MMYDYECKQCGFFKEELVKTPDSVVPCDGCDNPSMQRKFPAPALGRLNTSKDVSNALRSRSLQDSKKRSEEYANNAKKQINKALGRT